ncbi:MAG: efflux RND transporter periplasmic adaptor subunit [Myxococcota bacterium]|jgi:RND family efflux transporter MFP subunit|nr:efflux RND transporter periplasmic adaptor subunit [Myxococcota bacterium]
MNTTKVLKAVLPVVVIVLGVLGLRALIASKPDAPRVAADTRALLVDVQPVTRARHEVSVRANGTVIAAEQVVLAPEINGRVVWTSDQLVPGGRFRRGEPVFRIDPRDYRLAVDAQSAEVQRAQLEVQLEEGRQRVAEREWNLFESTRAPTTENGAADSTAPSDDLALRRPQRETAEVTLRSARSAAERARLALSKASLTAPFNAMVLNENVDVGQLVGPANQTATLVGTDVFWVRVSVPLASLANLQLPDGDTPGPVVRVSQQVGGRRVERTGRVLRLLPDLDSVGAMARLLVAIEDPLALSEANRGSLPILLGSYVDVEIGAAPLESAVEVPRVALREGNRVFVMTREDTLSVRTVEVAWSRDESVLVTSGLEGGERIVTSRVPTPVDGMSLRTADDRPERPATAQAPTAMREEATR